MANLEQGDIFVMKEDLTRMYVYICNHPLDELKNNVICCSVCKSTDDTQPRITFLKSNMEYTPVAKHSDMNWVRRERDIITAIYENKETVAFMEFLRAADPDTKKEIMESLKPNGIRGNMERKKMEEWLAKNGGKA